MLGRNNAKALRYASIVIPVLLVIFVVFTTAALFYGRGRLMMETQLKHSLVNSAAISALQFSGEEIEQIQSPLDMDTELFESIVSRLANIRDSIPEIEYAYIMRATEDAYLLEFVADADALNSFEEQDANGNGIIEPDEELSHPGDTYPIEDVPALHHDAFQFPTSDEGITHDQWGALISGYAPIRDSRQKTIAVLGLDMAADDFISRSQSIFSPVALILFLLIGVLFSIYLAQFIRGNQTEQALQMERERAALVDLATHQLGVPLAIFRWWVEILKDQAGAFFEDSDICVQMEDGIQKMESIIDALKDAHDVQKGTMGYNARTESITTIINDVVPLVRTSLENTEKDLELSIEKDLFVRMDKKLMKGVIQELIENAISYSPSGTTIFLRAFRKKKSVVIEVEDEGYGITQEDLPHIFDQFRRGIDAEKYKPVGNGVGLIVAKGIIELGGGKMSISSTVGKGTTVSFNLPIK